MPSADGFNVTTKERDLKQSPPEPESHFGLLVILQTDFFYQSKLGLQPVHVLFLILKDIFQQFATDVVPLRLTVMYRFRNL